MSLPFAPILSKFALVGLLALPLVAHAEVTGRVTRVLDGDTIEILRDKTPVRIRLAAIDAPERKCSQAFSEASRQSLATMVAGRTVTVIDQGTDRYGRTLGQVVAGRLDVNAEQVRLGYAWRYRAYSTDPNLMAYEARARIARRGLWRDKAPIAPWDWRRTAHC